MKTQANDTLENQIIETDDRQLDDAVPNDCPPSGKISSWLKWAEDIQENVILDTNKEREHVKGVDKIEGSEINPYFCREIHNYLLSKMSIFPVWSCICSEKFEYGIVDDPGSSACVESEMNNLKNRVFKNRLSARMRVDEALEKHCKYLQGKMNIAINNMLEEEREDQEEQTEQERMEQERMEQERMEQEWEQEAQREHERRMEREQNMSISPPRFSSASQDSKTKDNISISSDDSDKENYHGEHFSSEPLNETFEHENNINCPACANKDMPQGAHKCVKCNRAVHALNQCSVPESGEGEDEGYGQRRICLSCFSQNIPESSRVLAGNQVENWGGEVLKNKKKKNQALYLGNNTKYIKEKLSEKKHRCLPVIKNGSHFTIKPININNKLITLINTCHADSIFQLLLVGATDHPEVKQAVSILYEL